MSDLPTVTVDGDRFVGELPFYITDYGEDLAVWPDELPPGTYALVPVEQMERVWVCHADGLDLYECRAHPDRAYLYGLDEDTHEGEGCGWRYLVPVPKEGK